MNLKDHTVPDLQFILQVLLDTKPLGPADRNVVQTLRSQRTYSRAEKELISGFVKKYNLQLNQVLATTLDQCSHT